MLVFEDLGLECAGLRGFGPGGRWASRICAWKVLAALSGPGWKALSLQDLGLEGARLRGFGGSSTTDPDRPTKPGFQSPKPGFEMQKPGFQSPWPKPPTLVGSAALPPRPPRGNTKGRPCARALNRENQGKCGGCFEPTDPVQIPSMSLRAGWLRVFADTCLVVRRRGAPVTGRGFCAVLDGVVPRS